MRRSRCGKRVGALAIGLLALAACDYGDTRDAALVGDTSARLEGLVHTDGAKTVGWWFEYGPTPSFGEQTPTRSHVSPAAGAQQVTATVTGLAEDITYHYRHCVQNPGGGVVCGAPRTFTTTNGRDSVLGFGVSYEIPELGYHVGASIDATSDPDGSNPAGEAYRSPGVHYFRIPDEGPVTCLRVDGNRAAVGFVADYTQYDPGLPLVNVVVYVEDNGTAGDRFAVDLVDEAPATCPDPDVLLDAVAGEVITRGDFVVHDHP